MWLSKQMKPEVPTADADLGTTTIAGGNAGVVTRGEVRALPVYGPGGEEQCVAGAKQQVPEGMKPGEVYLHGPGDGAIYLREDGTVELRGTISIRGQLVVNGEPYKPCTCGTSGTEV